MTGDRSVVAAAMIGVVTLVGFLAVMVGGGHGSGVRTVTPEHGPASPIGVPRPPVARNVYLAPFGDFPQEDVEALVAHYREKFDLAIRILPSIPIPDDAIDATRHQLIAERLLDALAASEAATRDPNGVVIALTDADIYIASQDWRYAYGMRSLGTLAVVSSARMVDLPADPDRQMERLRKMVTKNLGILYYGLDVSDDPRSVLYKDILGPDDLDYMSEDF